METTLDPLLLAYCPVTAAESSLLAYKSPIAIVLTHPTHTNPDQTVETPLSAHVH